MISLPSLQPTPMCQLGPTLSSLSMGLQRFFPMLSQPSWKAGMKRLQGSGKMWAEELGNVG